MPKADIQTVSKLLREYAQRTALRGGNPYRSKAYLRAADALSALAVPLDQLIAEERLTEIPGVGDAIADIITKLRRTGTHPSLEKLREEIPPGVLELLTVPGLRPEKVLRLYKDLGITSLEELESAAKEDRIKKAKGLGAALQAKILENLAIARTAKSAFTCTGRPPCLGRGPISFRPTVKPGSGRRFDRSGDVRFGGYACWHTHRARCARGQPRIGDCLGCLHAWGSRTPDDNQNWNTGSARERDSR